MKPSLCRRLAVAVFVFTASIAAAQGGSPARPPQGSTPAQGGSTPAQGSTPPQGGAQPSQGHTPPPPPLDRAWWRSESYRKDLALTNDQMSRLDHIYLEAYPRLTEEAEQLDERESKLSRLIEANADEARIAAQIDRVESMRSALNKERQLMLVHMRAVLMPQQRVKFNERWLRRREAQQQPQQRQSAPSGSRPPSSASPSQRPAPSAPSSGAPTRRPN